MWPHTNYVQEKDLESSVYMVSDIRTMSLWPFCDVQTLLPLCWFLYQCQATATDTE